MGGSNSNPADIGDLLVIQVFCKFCKAHLSQRGCKTYLNSDLDYYGYSTDTIPETGLV